ncbi:hypothetical protein AWC20_14850 [Mycobacterium parmense]|nr:hypothetical protein AWC20_14850 [Mycobacterium parmense]
MLKTGLQLVALGGAAMQCGGQVLHGHARLHGGNQSSNLGIRLAKLALQGGVASTGCRVHVLPVCEVFRIGQGGDPFVKSRSHLVFTEIDGARMITQVHRYRPRLTQLTTVEDAGHSFPDASGALHPPSTRGTEKQPAERIRHRRFSAAHETGTTPCQRPKTNSLHQFIGNQRFMRAAVWCDPVGLITPPHTSLIPRRDIIGVDQDLVFLLLAPNTDTAVRRVVEYRADRRMGPSSRVTMTIPRRVVLTR